MTSLPQFQGASIFCADHGSNDFMPATVTKMLQPTSTWHKETGSEDYSENEAAYRGAFAISVRLFIKLVQHLVNTDATLALAHVV